MKHNRENGLELFSLLIIKENGKGERDLDKMLDFFNNFFSTKKIIVNTLCSAGILLIGGGVGFSFKEELILSFLKNHETIKTILSFSDWFLIFLGISLILLAVWIHFKPVDTLKKNTDFLIKHSSIETTVFKTDESNENEGRFLDQVEEMKTLNKKNIKASIEKVNKFSNEMLIITDKRKNLNIFYYGLSHIPLTILLGYQISDKIKVSHAEWNQNKSRWDLIKDGNPIYPKLTNGFSNGRAIDAEEVVLKIEMTTFISDAHLKEINLDSIPRYNLSVENPERNIIKSEKQLQEYQKEFRNILDKINEENPQAKRVHLFYSGPPSLAFKIGSSISKRMDKEILVYNFSMKETPKYKWYLKLTKSNEKIEFDIRKDDSK